MRHDKLLYLVRNRVKILLFLKQNLTAVLFPVVPKMALKLPLKLGLDIKTTTVRLVLDPANQIKPLLQLLVVLTFILPFDVDDNLLELVHQNREESDAKYLNYRTKYLFHYRLRTEVSIAHSR